MVLANWGGGLLRLFVGGRPYSLPLMPLPAGRLPLEGRVERPCALMRGSVPSHNGCSILLYGGGRITQLQYLLLKYSQFLGANFREIVKGEVRRIPLPRRLVNRTPLFPNLSDRKASDRRKN